jgi:hypothetical protein
MGEWLGWRLWDMVLSQDRQLGYDRLLAWLRAGGVLADGILGLTGEGGAVDDLEGLLREIDRLKGCRRGSRSVAKRSKSIWRSSVTKRRSIILRIWRSLRPGLGPGRLSRFIACRPRIL